MWRTVSDDVSLWGLSLPALKLSTRVVRRACSCALARRGPGATSVDAQPFNRCDTAERGQALAPLATTAPRVASPSPPSVRRALYTPIARRAQSSKRAASACFAAHGVTTRRTQVKRVRKQAASEQPPPPVSRARPGLAKLRGGSPPPPSDQTQGVLKTKATCEDDRMLSRSS